MLKSPGNKTKAVALTESQFAYSFGNAIPPENRRSSTAISRSPLPDVRCSRPPPPTSAGTPPPQWTLSAATGDHCCWSPPARTTRFPKSSSGERTSLYERGGAPAELHTYSDRGHSAAFDHGWRELADDTLSWLHGHGLRP